MTRLLVLFLLLGSGYTSFYKLGIGVYIMNIADINVVAGSFYADYLLTIYKDEVKYPTVDDLVDSFQQNSHKRTCSSTSSGTFKALNYSAEDIFIVNVDRFHNFLPILGDNASLLGQHRVMAVHYFRPDLKAWPFDSQRLPIVIDLARQVATPDISAVVCHMPEFSGVSSAVMFPGGSSHTLSFDFVTFERCWPPFVYPMAQCSGSNFGTSDCDCPAVEDNVTLNIPHSNYSDFSCRCKGGKYLASEYQFSVIYDTPEGRGFQREILPVLFIMIVNLISYLIPPSENSIRVTMCSSTLIAAVLFHSGIQNQVPPTGSLTTADVFLLVNYAVNLVSWIVTLVIVLTVNSPLIKRYDVPDHLYYVSRIFGPIISLSVVPSFVVYYENTLWWSLVVSLLLGFGLSTGLYIIQMRVSSYLRKTNRNGKFDTVNKTDGRRHKEDETDDDRIPLADFGATTTKL